MGAQIRHLLKAPITEALVDIRTQIRPGADIGVFQRVRAEVERTYPKVRPLQMFEGRFAAHEGQITPTASSAEAGLLFYSEDEKAVVQFRLDGFTFNKLQPYSSWEEIFPETWRLWDLYQGAIGNVQITRLAVRYINRLPLPSADFGRYLTALPQLPPELPQQVRSFLTRVVLYDERRTASAGLTQAFESPLEVPAVSVLLDIDAFKECDLSPSDAQLREGFEALHDFKNEIFFGSITEETARMFE